MKEYTTSKIRNVALVAHSGAGKTMLSEAMLHFTGAINRMGRIQDGSTVSDFEDEEIRPTDRISKNSLIARRYKSIVEISKHNVGNSVASVPGYFFSLRTELRSIFVGE